MDPALVQQAHDEDWPFGLAVAKGCSVAPPAGAPAMPALVEALADSKGPYVVREQDMYPCDRHARCPTPSRAARPASIGLGLSRLTDPGAADDHHPDDDNVTRSKRGDRQRSSTTMSSA